MTLRNRGKALCVFVAIVAFVLDMVGAAHAGDAKFQSWLQGVWPDAQRAGVSRATFDAATRNLEPDLALPDLVIPGRAEAPGKEQAEFVQVPADYLKESALNGLAAQGRKLASEHRATLAAIEEKFGVPGPVLLAIWGRETAYGTAKLPHNAIRVLATQAYLGRRKDHFREQFVLALKILEERHVTLAEMRSSWAGAMGHTQFLPADFFKHAVDFDGDGRRDIWRSVPDALASTARQLLDKGWQPGRRWAYEVRVPWNVDCTIAQPGTTMPLADWLKRGYVPVHGRKPTSSELSEPASLLLPEGTYGPGFLTLKNYYVLKDYNFSDLYVLFVGHLGDRITDPRPFETPWAKGQQLRSAQVEAMQRRMTELGLYRDKLDGKAGMLTRAALGAYQKQNGLKVDCWPTPAVLNHMQGNVTAN
jgi:lytic murein transglycosylase